MGKNKNTSKIIIILLILIILLLLGFIIFFIEEFMDERQEIRNLYKSSESLNTDYDDSTSISSYNSYSNSFVMNSNENSSNINRNYITKENALKIALSHAQINLSDICEIEVEFDYKYNQTVYEVTFNYKQYEYEYYINAESGNIIKSFREIDY